MLRIHTEGTPETVTLRLEGRLVRPWDEELTRAWVQAREQAPRSIRVDLDAVSFVDDAGCRTLATLHSSGCALHGSGTYISALIEAIRSAHL